MASGKKAPPKFYTPYAEWREELCMWELLKCYEKKEQGLIVRLHALQDNVQAKRAVTKLSAAELNGEDGLKKLLDALDLAFKADQHDEEHYNYRKFTSYKRKSTQEMKDFILEFEHLYHKMTASNEDMKFGDSLIGYVLLDAACLSAEGKKLVFTALATQKTTLETVKSALTRIFSSGNDSNRAYLDNDSISMQIKQEEALYVKRKSYKNDFSKYGKSGSNSTIRFNPKNKFGQLTRCKYCDATLHWAYDCQHKHLFRHLEAVNMNEDSGSDEDSCEESVNIVLMTETTCCPESVDNLDPGDTAVIDTACTKTVAGNEFIKNYIDRLSLKQQSQVSSWPSKTTFKFGDGRKVKSLCALRIPIKIGCINCSLNVEIVDQKIPLLLSKTSLERADTVIHTNRKIAHMFGQDICMFKSTAGHYCIKIFPEDEQHGTNNQNEVEEVMVLAEDDPPSKKKTEIKKLHRQFGHASVQNITKLLKNAELFDSSLSPIIEAVVNDCDICISRKKSPAKPVVGLPKADEFNKCVSMDLHELAPNTWYLHMVDEFSRFSKAIVITKKSITGSAFLKCWIAHFGPPERIFSDNGGEFCSRDFYELCELFNIAVDTTPAYSPWSNGQCERHNQFLTEMVVKIKDDVNCSWDTAVCWAVCAKNNLFNNHGFTPAQLVLGSNGKFPSVLTDDLPALDSNINNMSSIFSNHLSALHAARRAFTAAESSERIKRALAKQTRQSRQFFEIGEKVFFKRDSDRKWKGPAKVVGQDGAVVFLRQGYQILKVHCCRVQPVKRTNESVRETEQKPTSSTHDSSLAPDDDNNSDSESSEETIVSVPNESSVAGNDGVLPETVEKQVPECPVAVPKLKKGQTVSFIPNNSSDVHKAVVISAAGKKSGPHRNWYNIKLTSPVSSVDKMISIDMGSVKDLSILDSLQHSSPQHQPTEEILIIDDGDFAEAKLEELESWRKNGVYHTVPHQKQKCISVRWVCTMKDCNGVMKPKARLVARGFEENASNIVSDSPTCSKDSLRALITVACQRKWQVHSIDIKTAFLQGEKIDRDVYLKPPMEAHCTNVVWKLNKCVYGLTDASLRWYDRVVDFMCSAKGRKSILDPAVFYWSNGTQIIGLVAVHVDDFIWCGTQDFETSVIGNLRNTFLVGKEEMQCFQYLGIQLKQSLMGISIDQYHYIDSLKEIDHLSGSDLNSSIELDDNLKDELRSKVGQLLWVANQTRPDISFDVSSTAVSLKTSSLSEVVNINKIIRKVRNNSLPLQYFSLGKDTRIVAYTDAAFANLSDGGSQGGYLIFLVNGKGNSCLLSWESKRIRRVVRSALAAECLALSECIDAAIFVSMLFKELMYGDTSSNLPEIEIITDSKSLCDAIKSVKNVTEKRLRVDIGAVKEALSRNDIHKISWVSSEKQLADCLTKHGASNVKLMQALRYNKLPC